MLDEEHEEGKRVRGKHKKGRVIIRNLSFKIKENFLKEEFSKFGEIVDVTIPKKPDGKMRGFGFVEFEKTASAIKAINALNAKELLGRPVAIDFALAKNRYEKLISQKHQRNEDSLLIEDKAISDQNNEEKTFRNKKSNHLKRKWKTNKNQEDSSENEESFSEEIECESEDSLEEKEMESEEKDESSEGEESESESEEESSEENGNSDLEDEEEEVPAKKMKVDKPQRPNDAHEGKTLFIRNLSFDTTAENLKEALSKFGLIKYCLLCIDKLTDYPRGTAFVQFVNKEDAENCLTETSDTGNNIVLDGRKLNITVALSPDDIKRNKEERMKKGKDNRNMKLLTEGLIRAGSDAAKGVSQADIKKRLELEAYKKRLLKNLHYFISPVRLCIHNLPPHIDDNKLKKLFLKAVGPEAKVLYAKVMRNLRNLDDKGVGISKGFGFVHFTKHEDALQALQKLNNNPETFTPNKRPIVEFSIENRQILNAKKRQVERQQGKVKFFSSIKKDLPPNPVFKKIKGQKQIDFKNKNKNKGRKHKTNFNFSKQNFGKQNFKKGKTKKMKRKNFKQSNKTMKMKTAS